jgi:UTP--glucose-1-phosphate uridylyltransferase
VTDIKKAVIPVAGLGTRFLPATKAMPKEMLPLIDRPIIQYVVEEAIQSGIEDIILITGRGKRAIEDYFDDAPELEMHLRNSGKIVELQKIQEISSLVDIHYVRQKEPLGLGDAVLRSEKHIGNESFAVLLGDDIIVNDQPCTKQLIEVYNRYRCTIIAVEKVPFDKIGCYGIIDGKKIDDSLYSLENIIEKPEPCDAPSSIGAIGRYLFTPDIFDSLKQTGKGVGGEIQLTDAIKHLSHLQRVYAYSFAGKRYDTGDKIGYIKAIIDFTLKDGEISEDVIEYLKEVVKR